MQSVDDSTPADSDDTDGDDDDDDADDADGDGDAISSLAAEKKKKKKKHLQAVYWVRSFTLFTPEARHMDYLTIYKGLNNTGAAEQNLAHYCEKSEGIDILILTFLSNFGNGKPPSGAIHGCNIDGTSDVSNKAECKSIANGIQTCQKRGKKVFISLGGGGASGAVTSKADAEAVGKALWNQYGGGSGGGLRPFGKAVVNGFDLDVESSSSATILRYLVSELRKHFKTNKNKKRKYHVSGAPQCPIPEKNLGDVIKNAKLDYLFIQFYNNPGCSGQGKAFNFPAWEKLIKGTKSAKAKLFVGLPASKEASSGDNSGSKYYLSPSEMMKLVNKHKKRAKFGGVMLWNAGYSDTLAKTNTKHTYAQEVRCVLNKGKLCK